mmetsp:Transcript_12633/g.30668  ORF Transcript_12633/g.30668 Transcript_12633/m.30668 type:complete len:212 (+) Transcript_12633:931-1566(+)
MTSSEVVRCSWYTARHCSRMCRRALRTATCTDTSGRVSPRDWSSAAVVVPLTARVSTTTTPVMSSTTGPTFSSEYAALSSLTTKASASPTAPRSPPQIHTAASAGVRPYPHRVRMGKERVMTTTRAKITSRYTSTPQPRSATTRVPSPVFSAVVSAMITPVRMKSTVLATKVSISQKWCRECSVSPVKNPRPNAPIATPSTTTASTPLAAA